MVKKDKLIKEYGKVIYDVTDLLKNKNEWKKRYNEEIDECQELIANSEQQTNEPLNRQSTSYQAVIANMETNITGLRKKFRALDPVFVYLSVSKVKLAKEGNAMFDLRYEGQSVAELIVAAKQPNDSTINKEFKVSLKIDDKKANTNQRDFGFPRIIPGRFDWNSNEASAFRKFFSSKPQRTQDATKVNREHRFESVILTDLLKRYSTDKTLVNIRPVLLCGARFQMPTPINSSKAKEGIVTYSGQFGGGIDILARAGKSGRKANLCVIEVKDENTSKEPPQAAMKQAIAYATFIRELLRDKVNGSGWWKLFGFSGAIPDKLTIFTVVAMPRGAEDEIYPGEIIKIGDKDEFVLHYIYIDSSNGQPISATFP